MLFTVFFNQLYYSIFIIIIFVIFYRIPTFMGDIEELINNKFVEKNPKKMKSLDKDIEDIIILGKKIFFEDKKIKGKYFCHFFSEIGSNVFNNLL